MNENPGETPNPLNTSGVKPVAGPAPAPTPAPAPEPAPEPAPAPTPTAAPEPAAVPVAEQGTIVESLDPDGRPMEKADAPITSGEPKKKTGLIVGIIIAAVVIIGGAIAVALLLPSLSKGDVVAAAINKIMSGQAPEKVAVKGDIGLVVNQEGSPIKKVGIALDTSLITSSLINTTKAAVTFTTYDDKDYTVNFDEVYAANGDLFFKLDGVTEALEDSDLLNLLMGGEINEAVDCDAEKAGCDVEKTEQETSSETDTAVDLFSGILDAVETVDGVWLRISTDEIKEMSEGYTDENNTLSCFTNMANDFKRNSNITADLYSKYPFVVATNENVKIQPKNSPVYLVSLDGENLANYINSVAKSEITDSLFTCLGYEEEVSVDEESVAGLVAELPKVYVEVNNDNDFTRLYLETDLNDGAVTAVVDLGFSYPQNVNASEPTEYDNFSEVLQKLMSGMYILDAE